VPTDCGVTAPMVWHITATTVICMGCRSDYRTSPSPE
jgi:hypothetical protein